MRAGIERGMMDGVRYVRGWRREGEVSMNNCLINTPLSNNPVNNIF